VAKEFNNSVSELSECFPYLGILDAAIDRYEVIHAIGGRLISQ
jgi:hypothetical protein